MYRLFALMCVAITLGSGCCGRHHRQRYSGCVPDPCGCGGDVCSQPCGRKPRLHRRAPLLGGLTSYWFGHSSGCDGGCDGYDGGCGAPADGMMYSGASSGCSCGQPQGMETHTYSPGPAAHGVQSPQQIYSPPVVPTPAAPPGQVPPPAPPMEQKGGIEMTSGAYLHPQAMLVPPAPGPATTMQPAMMQAAPAGMPVAAPAAMPAPLIAPPAMPAVPALAPAAAPATDAAAPLLWLPSGVQQ